MPKMTANVPRDLRFTGSLLATCATGCAYCDRAFLRVAPPGAPATSERRSEHDAHARYGSTLSRRVADGNHLRDFDATMPSRPRVGRSMAFAPKPQKMP